MSLSVQWQAVLVVLAVLVPVTVLLVWLFHTRVFIWKPLHCRFEGVTFVAPQEVTPERLAAALEAAADALAEHVEGWSSAEIAGCVDGSQILVAAFEKWQNVAGQWVGGEQDGRILKVNVSLTSLCHEMAHLCELGIDARVDDGHGGWMRRGIWAADNDFRAWLEGAGRSA